MCNFFLIFQFFNFFDFGLFQIFWVLSCLEVYHPPNAGWRRVMPPRLRGGGARRVVLGGVLNEVEGQEEERTAAENPTFCEPQDTCLSAAVADLRPCLMALVSELEIVNAEPGAKPQCSAAAWASMLAARKMPIPPVSR